MTIDGIEVFSTRARDRSTGRNELYAHSFARCAWLKTAVHTMHNLIPIRGASAERIEMVQVHSRGDGPFR